MSASHNMTTCIRHHNQYLCPEGLERGATPNIPDATLNCTITHLQPVGSPRADSPGNRSEGRRAIKAQQHRRGRSAQRERRGCAIRHSGVPGKAARLLAACQ